VAAAVFAGSPLAEDIAILHHHCFSSLIAFFFSASARSASLIVKLKGLEERDVEGIMKRGCIQDKGSNGNDETNKLS
jgi:hypothetical protein